MTDAMNESLRARATDLLAARIPAGSVGWLAHRTASSRAQALLDLLAEVSGDPTWLAAAGYERGTRAATTEEAHYAASQLARAIETAKLPQQHQVLLADLLILLREDARIAQLLATGRLRGLSSVRRRMLNADLANPFRTPGLPEHEWLRTVQPLLSDLAPVRLGSVPEGQGHEPIDRLTADVEAATLRGDLVSVIISSYRPGPALDTAVRSILAQTWADLEVLVIDDASGEEYSDIYAAVAALDDRVRVIRQAQNGGTYVARNTAIDQARGTYVTFQDADDWSHPERIARQVAAFERDPLVHSVRARSLRTSGTLVFARQGTAVLAPGAVTLMFRREQVWPVLGSFDTVRKAADTEFHQRISAALSGYGVDLREPLLWYRVGEDSLSRSEFRAAWRHSSRLLYHSAWTHWHEQIRRGASPRLDPSVRSFPAPHRFRLDQSAPPDEFDLVVLGDWRGDGHAARDAIEWIRILAADGVRIALVHAESLNFEGRTVRGLMAPAQELVAAGTIEAVPWDDPVKTKATVVIEPEVLEYLPDTAPGARTPAMVVLLDSTPRAASAIDTTEAIVRDRWGARVVWSPRGEAVGLDRVNAEVLGGEFPAFMPGQVRPPLHRPKPVVVVAPLGIDPGVLDQTWVVGSALADRGVDVRVRLAEGVRDAILRRDEVPSPRLLWATSVADAAATTTAIATDVIIIGPAKGIEFDRLVDDARIWGVRTHLLAPGDLVEEADGAVLGDLVERVLADVQVESIPVETPDQATTATAVRTWFENVSTLN